MSVRGLAGEKEPAKRAPATETDCFSAVFVVAENQQEISSRTFDRTKVGN